MTAAARQPISPSKVRQVYLAELQRGKRGALRRAGDKLGITDERVRQIVRDIAPRTRCAPISGTKADDGTCYIPCPGERRYEPRSANDVLLEQLVLGEAGDAPWNGRVTSCQPHQYDSAATGGIIMSPSPLVVAAVCQTPPVQTVGALDNPFPAWKRHNTRVAADVALLGYWVLFLVFFLWIYFVGNLWVTTPLGAMLVLWVPVAAKEQRRCRES